MDNDMDQLSFFDMFNDDDTQRFVLTDISDAEEEPIQKKETTKTAASDTITSDSENIITDTSSSSENIPKNDSVSKDLSQNTNAQSSGNIGNLVCIQENGNYPYAHANERFKLLSVFHNDINNQIEVTVCDNANNPKLLHFSSTEEFLKFWDVRSKL